MSDADAVIVLQPGLMGGAGSLEPVSRMMVYMALKQRGKRLEVLVLDRRNNNLEDLTGMIAAQEAHDTQVAIDYYCNGAEIDGRKFAGFLTDADMPYFSEFGLELAMKDVYNVIITNVPDPAMRRQKVFVGGHSLGGPFTCFFAGWDFDGNPQTLDDAGYMNCAGLIGLDTLLEPDIPFLKSTTQEALNLDPPATGEEEYFNTVIQDIREGWLPRMIPANVTGPEVFAFIEVAAMEAAWHPDEESNLLDRVPYSP